jgi:hypothetical protein
MSASDRAAAALRDVDTLIEAAEIRRRTGSWERDSFGSLRQYDVMSDAIEIISGKSASLRAGKAIDEIDAALQIDAAPDARRQRRRRRQRRA